MCVYICLCIVDIILTWIHIYNVHITFKNSSFSTIVFRKQIISGKRGKYEDFKENVLVPV